MFIAIVLITVGIVALLSFRNWVKYQRLTIKEKQCHLVNISKLILLEEWQEAKKEILSLMEKNELGKEGRLLYIQVLRGTKEFDKALEVAISASREEPEELLYRVEEGKTLLEMGEASGALEAFTVAEAILRKESDLLDYSTAYLKAGFPEKSWEILEPLLTTAPGGNVLACAGDAQLELKQYSQAIAFYHRGIEKGYNTHQVQTQLGNAHRLLGNYNEAEGIFRNILEKDSGDVLATLGLGACMQERGFYLKALLIYQAGRAWTRNDPRILLQTAYCALYSHRFHHAEHYFLQVIKMQGLTSDLLFHYCYALEQQQKWQEAEQHYLRSTELYPADVRGYRALAWLFGVGLSTVQTVEQGMEHAHKMLTQSSPDILSWEIMSAVKARLGLFEEAYQIQEYLAAFDQNKAERVRRTHLLKNLRKELPLDVGHISRRLVA